jgi:hypothetical protein
MEWDARELLGIYNAIGEGSIPKIAVLAGLDTAKPVEPVFGMATPTGASTKS